MLETFKSSGVRPGRIKVEVQIEQNTDSSQSFLDGLGINASQFTPSRF